MHDNNRKWLTDLQQTYPAFFTGAAVLEIGARIWGEPPNDTIRPFFTDCRYIGVDAVDGPGVDHVMQAQHTTFEPGQFDTLAIFSVFEHDPAWRETLAHNLSWLRAGGLLVTCFGAEGNQPNLMNWKPVPHREFLEHCAAMDLVILDAFFEEERYGPNCAGCYNVVAGKPNILLPDYDDKPAWRPPS